MTPTQQKLYHAALWSMLISAAAVVVSIAICQIFLGLALIASIASEAPLRFPPIKAPLAASPQPSAGLPQVRKIFVYSVPLIASSVLTETKHARWLVGAWSAAAAASALRSLIQLARKLEAARASGTDFYQYYVAERITGFLSHWMTFSEVGMMVLLALLGYLFFAPGVTRVSRWLGGGCVALVLFSIVVGFTRGIWLATAAGVIYLVWQWRPKLLLAAPVLGLVVFFAAPAALQPGPIDDDRPPG
jgi:putative inorganic carbon (HCO3(-)) transporter